MTVSVDTSPNPEAPNKANPNFQGIETTWQPPPSLREWDKQFPGIFDGIGLLAGTANIIMQLANSPVGHGVSESRVESGDIFKNPLKRTRTSLVYIVVALAGTNEEKLIYRKAVNTAHAQVYSLPESKVKYNAFDPQLQLWVAACIYWGLVDTAKKMNMKRKPTDAEDFYQMAAPLGTALQVRASMWPADSDAFNDYFKDGMSKIHIDDSVRVYLNKLIDLEFAHPLIHKTLCRFNRFMTTGFLPTEVREAMHLTWNENQERSFKRMLAVLSGINRMLPRVIRQYPYNILLRGFRQRVKKGLPLV
jgi:uncharacterized protein (DUF2236 family)